MLFVLLLLHAVCGTAVLVGGRRLGRGVWLLGALAPASAVVWLLADGGRVVSGAGVANRAEWVPELGLALDLRADPFSALMIVLVSGIGVLVYAYAWHYFGTSGRAGRVAGLLTLFAGSMLGVVLADNLLALYVFWELTSITSYLLIGVDDADPDARAAAQHALLVTALGGLVMLGGFVVLGQEAGTYQISEMLAAPPAGTTTAVALVLILVGAFTKSAQYPFHSWLPGAMVAPTPISAYLHSAAMVKAGVYLVARLAPGFAAVGPWRPLVVGVGLVTMIAGGLRALRPFDLKQLLAFGTISQLGFMTVLFGIGRPAATAAGCALILAHGLFKAALFMVVGIVDHEAHTRDIRRLPALGRGWGPTKVVAVVSAASMAAIPPLAGFIAKEQAYGALVDGSGGDRVALAGIVAGSVLTVVYSVRFTCALIRPSLVSDDAAERAVADHAPGQAFVLPAAVLAAGSIVLGVVPAVWSAFVDHAADALDPRAHAHLELWHGVTAPLVLSLVTLGTGALLFWRRRQVAAVQAHLTFPVTGAQVYEGTVRGVLELAGRVTSLVQSGSLPIYAGIILSTAAIASVAAMVSGAWWPGWPDLVGGPAHIPIAGILLGGGVAATVARRRFAAALLLGVVGYGMAMLFVVQGAPDLALTQFAIETLSVVVFLLVLRVLPDRFERRAPAVNRPLRLAVSAAVGIFVVLMAIAAAGSRTEPSVSREMSDEALPEGHGRNVVNVILVDIRGMDTMGEITVLATAGIGIVALARAGRPPRRVASPSSRSDAAEEVGSE
ncbi:MAG TPA: hydrogen gas-evolving membrane-bound hydrogenase subunit E [Acidimicrobiales bacterium]|nr:hydrogen gas-evolving membrane-bound hydrogenase subunit E [Acidimicrobiales bacterium]